MTTIDTLFQVDNTPIKSRIRVILYTLKKLALEEKDLLLASKFVSLPIEVREPSRQIVEYIQTPFAAGVVIAACMLSKDDHLRETQIEYICDLFSDPKEQELVRRELSKLYLMLRDYGDSHKLPIIYICVNMLKYMPLERYERFRRMTENLSIESEFGTGYEMAIRYIVTYPLDIHFGLAEVPLAVHSHFGAVKQDVEIVASSFTYFSTNSDEDSEILFEILRQRLGLSAFKYIPHWQISAIDVHAAIKNLQKAMPSIKKKMLYLAAICAALGTGINYREVELLCIVAESLNVPLEEYPY